MQEHDEQPEKVADEESTAPEATSATEASPEAAAQHSPEPSRRRPLPRFKFHWATAIAGVWFLVYLIVIAHGLQPLPDEPPRINFHGVANITGALVLAVAMFFDRSHGLQLGSLVFLAYAYWFIGERIQYFQMMLEPHRLEQNVQSSILVIALLLIVPSWRHFSSDQSERPPGPMLLKKGIPF